MLSGQLSRKRSRSALTSGFDAEADANGCPWLCVVKNHTGEAGEQNKKTDKYNSGRSSIDIDESDTEALLYAAGTRRNLCAVCSRAEAASGRESCAVN